MLLVVIIVTEDKEKTNQKEKKMVILRQQSEFVISGDIEQIKAELAKVPLYVKEMSFKTYKNSQDVFLGKFYLEIIWKNGEELTVPGWDVSLKWGNYIKVNLPPVGVCFFKNEDEQLYDQIISYITHIAMEELNKIVPDKLKKY